jgi:cobalt-zinc-cadmium efflux system outer membrane protein
MKNGPRKFGLVLLGAVAVVKCALAEPQEIVSSLTLEQVVAEALQENAQLRGMRAKWEAMRERPVQARTLPNPMVAYRSMDATGGYRFPDAEEKRMEIEQQFPWFGKLALRGRIAEKDAEAMRHEYEAMRREVMMMAKESYFELYAVQRSLATMRGEVEVLQRMERIAETMYSTGRRTQQDVLKAQAEITMLQQKILELEQQETVLKAKLNQLLNRRADAPLGLAVSPPTVEAVPELEGLFALAERARPEIQRADAEIRRYRYERELMKKEFWPDWRLGVEYRSFRSEADMVMLTVGFELPIWQRKYRAGVREAEKMIESGKAALEATERRTSYDVQDAWFKLLTARRALELYRTALIPQAQARFEASEAGYRTGTVDFLDLLESERFLLNARVMAAMAEGNVGVHAARLERAVGAELPLWAATTGATK